MEDPTLERPPAIETRGLTKRFGSHLATDAVDLRVQAGSVHAIVGGNGAGKTTLVRMLHGVLRPDFGIILRKGQPVDLNSPRTAFRNGIGMVHQEFTLVPGLTLLENLVLGAEPTWRLGSFSRSSARHAAVTLAESVETTIDWDLNSADASIQVRQIVEILRLLYRGAEVLIFDEPSAVLATAQVASLLTLIGRLREAGHTILFISHKPAEILTIADRISVLRQGRLVETVERAQADEAVLMRHMAGGQMRCDAPRRLHPQRGSLLNIRGLCLSDGRGVRRLTGIDMDVCRGEILGLAGLPGAGQAELLECVAGLRTADAGRILLDGEDITALDVSARRWRGIRFLSPDRAQEGLCLDASVRDNVVAGHHRRKPLSGPFGLKPKAIATRAAALLDRYDVRRRTDVMPVRHLSGGNQQRIVIARELHGEPVLLLAMQPTRGVDLGGVAFVHQTLREQAAAGLTILLVSEDEDELHALSTRILVLGQGGVRGVIESGTDAGALGRLLLGGAA